MNRVRPPLQIGDTYMALAGSPLTKWNPDSCPDEVAGVQWLSASLKLVRRHQNGAIEFVVVEATGRPPRAPTPPTRARAPLPAFVDRYPDLEIPAFLDRRKKKAAS
jgi:hypothetical protein